MVHKVAERQLTTLLMKTIIPILTVGFFSKHQTFRLRKDGPNKVFQTLYGNDR